MSDYKNIDNRLLIFANLFRVSNRLQTVMDRKMEDITSKQWFVLLALDLFDEPPTLKELADICDYSHQNTKQLLSKLEEKGFITIAPDKEDKRALRIIRTSKVDEWEKGNSEYAAHFVDVMFETLSKKEIESLSDSLFKIYEQLGVLGNEN